MSNERGRDCGRWLRFWFEPWAWADEAWRIRYGVPAPVAGRETSREMGREAGHEAGREMGRERARLHFSGWIDVFALEKEWSLPADARWLALLEMSPQRLRDASSLLGWLALLHTPGGGHRAHAAARDPVARRALRYRTVNCMRVVGDARATDGWPGQAHGLRILRMMAEQDWPDVASRLAMMLEPGTEAGESALRVETLVVPRCLALVLAAARWLGARQEGRAS
ncbi:hypothetical protein WKR88_18075 [Trinickia caryophylli]|uniref:Type III secretion protein (HrpB4) n=1 Tax=Trinickia caryophylli TaxID=28094 RepID=A0A1X7DZX1_TRICW|nr:hypothetical protein [Trinickia caryophylli]PMS14104.1 hypothetical protein C0Z17_00760 [Trinickia caryophylli]TRX17803.1 hypothetical protein FNF07_05900 [Trinickia caryophylli]WQE11430.1 hypothetical protein U0034_17015 [Trinickia caryophylli]SMF24772.1 hypothetical protein SAMN06295900_104288 [Trinickia caryophylli]GLU32594.1 hypothetical protein Busp01_24360 [Trinickia caryophylli]